MRVLIVNPNTTEEVTRRLERAAEAVISPECELKSVTAPWGLPYIASRAEAQIGGVAVLEMLVAHHRDCDVAVIAAFGDPGLFAARELFDIPIVGMSEASMLAACGMGRNFAVVTFSETLLSWYHDCVREAGMTQRCCGIHALSEAFGDVVHVASQKKQALGALVRELVEAAAPDTIILGGAPLAGLAREIAADIPVPVIDPIQAAVVQADAMLRLGWRKPTAGSLARPGPKEATGVSSLLADRIGHRDS